MYDPAQLKKDAEKIRKSGYFDEDWYRTTYPDVDMLSMDPAEHYLKYGALLGRKPSAKADAGMGIPEVNPGPLIEVTQSTADTPRSTSERPPFAIDYSLETLQNYAGKKRLSDIAHIKTPPKVSFVVTSYNAEDTIETSVTSLLRQNYPNLEVVVCDDASTDRSWEILQNLKLQSPEALRIVRLNQNGGTYLAKNIAITQSTGEFILFQDSDDHSHPDRALVQVLPLLENPDLIATRSKYLRFDARTKRIVPVADLYSKYGLITLAVRRRAFAEIGFFDAVRKAGDDEWFQRLSHLYGKTRIHAVDVCLYLAELREESLVADMLTFREDGSVDQASSHSRKEYVKIFQGRFRDKTKKRQWYSNNFRPYPLRPNRVYPETVAALEPKTPKVFATACCIPDRIESFRQVVGRLLPQVDGLFVFLDKFASVPDFLANNKKITVMRSQDVEGDPRDNAKFLPFDKLKAEHEAFYYFTCDDDILYPHDYTRAMISRLQNYDDAVVLGVHGVMYEENPRKYFRRRFIYHFQDTPLSQPQLVNNLGTGTVAFHSDRFETLNPSKWPLGGMVDIFFSKECRSKNIPMVCVDRTSNWLCETEQSAGTPTLFGEFSEKENLIVNELKSMAPWGYKAILSTLDELPSKSRETLQALLPPFAGQHRVENFFSRYR